MIKKILPYNLKVQISRLRNILLDIFRGYTFKYAKTKDQGIGYKGTIEITQQIKQTKHISAKLINFGIAIQKIEVLQINPNELFSFWRVIGRPSARNGYAKSRSIVKGEITETYGGGLCQVSGLLYYASILAKLEIIERHNHSKDIYTDATRFAPLGSDATVVYGFKDLKIKNTLKTPIRFTFLLQQNYLTIRINSTEIVPKNNIEFVNEQKNEIITYCNGLLLTKSTYR